MSASDFLGGLVGYLDSVSKAGLGAEAANATVHRDSGNSVIVEVRVANGAEVPGALSAFADHVAATSDAGGQTLQFTVDSGVVANGYHFFGVGASAASGGDGGSDLWIGGNGTNYFTGTGGHDILVGGASYDVLSGGDGFDFLDGGGHIDTLSGGAGNDILIGGKGNDYLAGGADEDTYVFNRGDGADTVLDEYPILPAFLVAKRTTRNARRNTIACIRQHCA
jgi:Ca2+-binding RTX toxin-like protein